MHMKWWQKLTHVRTIDAGTEPGGGDTNQDGQQPDPPATGGDNGDEKLGESGMNALKNERRTNKALREQLAEANARIKEFEDRDKTDAEKANEKIANLEQTSTRNAAKALRYEIAIDKQLPKALAERLQGSTREELEADADNLLQLVNVQNKPHVDPDPSQGKGGEPKPANLSEAISAYYR